MYNITPDDTSEMVKDELFAEAVRIVLDRQMGSVSLLQRRLGIGYIRASRIIEMMAGLGILGEYKGSQPREDLERVEQLRNLGVDPFVMPYNKKDSYQRTFARWVNHKAIFKKVRWEEYKNERTRLSGREAQIF